MDSLPDELLLMICETITTQHGKFSGLRTSALHRTRELYHLSLVSRRFNRIVTPMLYEHITGPKTLRVPFWRSIVEKVHQNPGLAQLIKSFSMTRQDPRFRESPPEIIRLELPTRLVESLASYKGATHKEILLDLERRSKAGDFIFMTLLILQASTIEMIRLGDFINRPGNRPHTRLPLVIEEIGLRIYNDLDAGLDPQCFGHLRRLYIDLEIWGYFPADAIIPLLYLPALKFLQLHKWGYRTRRRTRPRFGTGRVWPVRSSGVEELVLNRVHATSKQFLCLLTSCIALRKFEYTPFWHGEMARHAETILSLRIHAESLESVTLGTHETFFGLNPTIFRALPQLVSLKHLERHYIICEDGSPPENIVHYLPPSIEELMIVIRRGWGVAATHDGIESVISGIGNAICDAFMKGSLPHLKAVELQLLWEPDCYQGCIIPQPDVRCLISTFKGCNVRFGLSMFCMWHVRVERPNIETMRTLKESFPGICVFCNDRIILRLSTSPEPCVLRSDDSRSRQSPYDAALDPWDFENEDEGKAD